MVTKNDRLGPRAHDGVFAKDYTLKSMMSLRASAILGVAVCALPVGVAAQLSQSEAAITSNLVRLYKAMGGGWTTESLGEKL